MPCQGGPPERPFPHVPPDPDERSAVTGRRLHPRPETEDHLTALLCSATKELAGSKGAKAIKDAGLREWYLKHAEIDRRRRESEATSTRQGIGTQFISHDSIEVLTVIVDPNEDDMRRKAAMLEMAIRRTRGIWSCTVFQCIEHGISLNNIVKFMVLGWVSKSAP